MKYLSCVCHHCGTTFAFTDKVEKIVDWQDNHFCPSSEGKARAITLTIAGA